MELFFYKQLPYRIAIHYEKSYVENMDWDLFTSSPIKKYGQPIINDSIERLKSFSYDWADDETIVEISKGGELSSDKSRFIPFIYNVFYTDRLLRDKLERDTENETGKMKLSPNF